MSRKVTIKIDKEKIGWRKIANKTVILNKANKSRYILNDTAVTVWDHITESVSVRDAMDKISKEFSISREKVAADVDRFLRNLEGEEIISLEMEE